MPVINKGTALSNGEQLTAEKLNDLLDLATFSPTATDSVSTFVNSSGQIAVLDGGIAANKLATNAVTTTKILNANVTFAKLADVINDNTMDTASNTKLATSSSIKSYVDSRATRSKFITLTGGTNTLEYEQTTSDGSKVWTIADFTSSDPDFDVTKITSLVVECDVYAKTEATCKITATLPDGQVTTLNSVAPNDNQGGDVHEVRVINTVVLQINADQTTFTFVYDLGASNHTARTFIRGANCEVSS